VSGLLRVRARQNEWVVDRAAHLWEYLRAGFFAHIFRQAVTNAALIASTLFD